jgi:hypothetical protein
MQHRNRAHDLGDNSARCLRRRSNCHATPAPFDQLHHGITLVGIQTAELVLHLDAVLATEINEIFALQIELFRQRIDADFLLQMQLLYSQLCPPSCFYILTTL